jgi:ketosteroid isomerase-like protein
MSRENVEIVRAIYRAWTDGAPPTASGLIAEDIEWVNDERAVEPGTRRGSKAFDDAADNVGGTLASVRIEFERFLDAGDQVVVIGVLQGTGRGSGLEVGRRQGYLWTIRDGKAVRFQWFNDPDEALAAAGLES